MKNITLYRHISRKLPDLGNVEYFCVDVSSNDLYFVIGNTLHRYQYGTQNVRDVVNVEQFSSTPSISGVVGISHNVLPDGNVVCIAAKSGDLITYDCDSEEVQCVGLVESGLKAMQWSLDQEILVLVTGSDTIIIMTSTFDPLSEVDFHQENFGEKQFVSIGWGKKETQFHGSEGKAAALAGKAEIVPSANPDDEVPRISWREDGDLFAVSMLKKDTKLRYIRIFNREGVLQYTSEMVPGLEMTLSWRPSGNLLASTQTLPNKYQVVFFEKNGLRHGEFALPCAPKEGRVQQLAWNIASDILAVWYEDGKASYLQLWSVNNYHWYMKQCLTFPMDQKLLAMQWDAELGFRLHVLFGGLQYSSLDWIWVTNQSSVAEPSGRATVAVIDGCNILLTSFRESVIPPPMCDEKLELPVAVNQVLFGPSGICAILSDNKVAMFLQEGQKHSLVHTGPITWECNQPEFLPPPQLHHWIWVSEHNLLCACTMGQTSCIVHITLDDAGKMIAKNILDAGDIVLSIAATPDACGTIIQLQERKLLQYKFTQENLEDYSFILPQSYTHLQMVHVNDKDIILGLTQNNRLYIQSNEIANNVTSLFVHPEFLLITTSVHKLHCLKLSSDKVPELLQGRRIERGARLVIAVNTRVILQMPRGNLECITPRPLVIREAGLKLDVGKYYEVMSLLRKQRINLNLIVDHNPELFISNVAKFVEEITEPSWLSLFLLELRDEDVTVTMYSEYYSQSRPQVDLQPSKLKVVCGKVREAMQNSSNTSRLHLPIIASYVQMRTDEDLAEALLQMKNTPNQDEAISFLFCLADPDELYDIALGIYDLRLAVIIGYAANKDPQEFIPFIRKLRRSEEKYMRYTIDEYLKRFNSALEYIVKCPDHFDECLALVKRCDLYAKALTLLPKGSDTYKQIAAAYAEKLMGERLLTEAAIMYQRSDQLDKALEAYILAADWREALIIMFKLGHSGDELKETCRRLSSVLIQRRRYLEAAQLLSEYVNDIEESVKVLVLGHHWEEAVRLAYLSNRKDLIELHVKPGVANHFEILLHQVKKNSEQFMAQKARLAVVRTTKLQKLKDNELNHGDESDLFSETSSLSSSSGTSTKGSSKVSGRTSRSSKNKRKLERKLLSLKEGSRFEDLALIHALHNLMTTCFGLVDDVQTLCRVLVKCERDEDAANLQKLLSDLLDTMVESKSEIWPPELLHGQASTIENYGPDTTSNILAARMQSTSSVTDGLSLLDPHFRIPPQVTNSSTWKMKVLQFT